ncbi:hypothetical protein GUJ93_ZPchr0019g2668 [Zizania palustris]|uniref:Uncharacterized protein n=1 Tax=Zizania palustris TaxID=103762 RepID=A0A8J5W5K1_ZIZPA|nr:hypothetical protein GUJ93_ZPchr0019g2668 [Zizania palustris]
MPSLSRTVHLRCSAASPRAEAAAEEEAAIAVEGGGGVDLARVGRALGLDPATIRLNGYYISRGPGHVSSAVTWRSLLDFFAARGLPTGADPAAPVAVHGKTLPSAQASDHMTDVSPKRKFGLDGGRSLKKNKHSEDEALSISGDELLSDEITVGLKRRLKLEDARPAKKIKLIECTTVNEADTQQPVKFSCSFINGQRKRSRDEEMLTSLISCKRPR